MMLSLTWYAGTYSEYLGQFRMSRSSDQGQGHRSEKAGYTSVTNDTHSPVVKP